MKHWLMKSEPDEMSIDDLATLPKKTAPWTGVRNYTARNFMRDAMAVGDLAFFYHSSCPEPGVAGVVRVSAPAHADPTQFDPKSDYYDPKSARTDPRWVCVDVTFVEKTRLVSIAEMRAAKALDEMVTLQRGNRLSITPVTDGEWEAVLKLAKAKPKAA
jgi:predicted RNA-binding protein with PUA-like domain